MHHFTATVSYFQCRIDDTGIYHGHSAGVNKHSMADGSIIWSQKSAGSNMFGVQVGLILSVFSPQNVQYNLIRELSFLPGGGASVCGGGAEFFGVVIGGTSIFVIGPMEETRIF